jgi:hypothetical protein
MMSRGVEVVVLCEDKRHEQMVRAFLNRKDYNPHRYRFELGNNGYVLAKFSERVKLIRSATHKIALIAAIDGDEKGLDGRVQELTKRLVDAGLPVLATSEPVVILVPSRNIETWIHHFSGNVVDETIRYPKDKESHREEAAAFAEFVADGNAAPIPHLPALNAAREALRDLIQNQNAA